MDDFGDDLFDVFEKPSASSLSVGVQKSSDGEQNIEKKYIYHDLFESIVFVKKTIQICVLLEINMLL